MFCCFIPKHSNQQMSSFPRQLLTVNFRRKETDISTIELPICRICMVTNTNYLEPSLFAGTNKIKTKVSNYNLWEPCKLLQIILLSVFIYYSTVRVFKCQVCLVRCPKVCLPIFFFFKIQYIKVATGSFNC